MDTAFIQARIDATKAQIIAYEAAILAFGETGALQTYKLDTGQTVQTVTRADLKQMQETLDTLYNRCTTLEARLGRASGIAVPGF